MSSISVRSVATVTGNATSASMPDPAGRISTDGLFAIVLHPGNTQVSLPAGWSLVTSVFGVQTLRLLQFAGTGTGPWTLNFSVAGVPTASRFAITTVAMIKSTAIGASSPTLDVSASALTTGTGAVSTPTVTPTADDDLVVSVVTWGRGTTFTPPGAVTDRADIRTGDTSSDYSLFVGSETLTGGSGSPTTSRSITNDNPFGASATEYIAATLSFKSSPPPTAWDGGFDTGDLSQWTDALYETSPASPTRIEIRTDGPYEGSKYARFTALNDDLPASTSGARAQLDKKGLLYPGLTRWLSWATRFPSDFPVLPAATDAIPNPFLVIAQAFGAPYGGSPNIAITLDSHRPDRVAWSRGALYDYDTIWSTPLVRGEWLTFAMRIYFAQDETGWVEMYYRGEQQRFVDGSRRVYMQTVKDDETVGLDFDATLYFHRGMFDSVSLDHDAFRIDTDIPASWAQTVPVALPVRSIV